MLLEEFTICNVGLFRHAQTLQLEPPRSDKPIVLIGGLNGSGKTTLLDSIQLALYGKRARLSNRGTLAYEEYLRRAANRDAVAAGEESFVELKFRRWSGGREHKFQIRRAWNASGVGSTGEQVEVRHDGELDRVLMESWTDFMEEILPLEIAHLFFFDGEKIESFADVESAKQLLSKAVQSLLGLDVVGRLHTDLIALERRKQIALKSDAEQAQIEAAQKELAGLDDERTNLVETRAAAQNAVDRRAKDLREIEMLYEKSGGPLFDRRDELEGEQLSVRERLRLIENELRGCAEEEAPLLLVPHLLAGIEAQDGRETRAAEAGVIAEVLTKRDTQLLDWLRACNKVPLDTYQTISGYLTLDRERREGERASFVPYLNFDAETRRDLQTLRAVTLDTARGRIRALLTQANEARAQLIDVERKLASLPAEDYIAQLLARKDGAQIELNGANARLADIDAELKRLSDVREAKHARLVAQIERAVEGQFATEDATRMVTHARRVRDTIEQFRVRVVRRHAARIGELVLDCFTRLLRKESLVTALDIDAETFALRLRGHDGRALDAGRLSAGERQLLAVSMLWGLARASGRPLPVVIDTPLGRLDSSHRRNLIEGYFPHASHQVLLLSTDEEINGEYFQSIKPHLAHTYRLAYDDQTSATHIAKNYFW